MNTRIINLASGSPSPALIPVHDIQKAANTVLSTPSVWEEGLNYGADAGYLPLRQNLAQWLTEFYHDDRTESSLNEPGRPDAERICVTGGASQNLACILQSYTDPVYTKAIFVVEPAYFLSFRVFTDAGFDGKLKGIPEDDEGIDIKILEQSLHAEAEKYLLEHDNVESVKELRPYRKLYRYVIYCVPTFSNPSGRIMSLTRRQQLIQLARKYNVLVIADDVYDFVHWEIEPDEYAHSPSYTPYSQSPSSEERSISSSISSLSTSTSSPASRSILPRLVDIDRILDGGPIDKFGNAVSNGSFSKIVGPGCRVGWAEATPAFIYGLSQVGSTRSGGAPSQLTSTFINEMLQNGCITRHIQQTLIPSYKRRLFKLSYAIKQYLIPLGLTLISTPQVNDVFIGGGFFIWLKLPSPLTAKQVAAAAQQAAVIVGQGTSSALPEGNVRSTEYNDMLRLCFARVEEELLVEAVLILQHSISSCYLIPEALDRAKY
ncbi:hypothetical protein EYB25_006065 [Talaromyces marneffei]|uniref:uncharacterized protein n=1 Tax=Talaromyces marneffei TaxID=37727 RepID=UPI0012AAB993|nr:uncharacterized protein EYB26_006641 [Talaromyces marneffei]KAE8552171.1 hypothetical protein EYB25_006065 [Talaromyces marneffei]QGA18956.1 hypothetical protein EYB26_006641 [Talaromyces marneffei]